MSTSVADLLKLPIYQKYAKVVVSCGLDRNVQYLTVMEASDFHFGSLDKNVFILTTLSAHYETLDAINAVLKGLCEAGIAAIGIKLGRFINEIAPSTIEIVTEYQVPLITFSQDVLFREILSTSLALISDNQKFIIDQINTLNRELFEAILQSRPMAALIQLLCDKIKCYGCCIDSGGTLIAKATSISEKPDQALLQGAALNFRTQSEIWETQHYIQQGNIIIFPCWAQNQLMGIFCIVLEGECSELILSLSETTVNALGVKFLEHTLKLQTEREMTSAILNDILFSKQQDEMTIVDRLTMLGFTPCNYHMVLTFQYREEEPAGYDMFYATDVIQSILLEQFNSAIVFTLGEGYIALLSYKREKDPVAIARCVETCSTSIEASTKKEFLIGGSISTDDLRQIPRCYEQARQAAKYGEIIHPEKNIYLYYDYFEIGLIDFGLNSEAGKIFEERIIRPILEYDRKYKSGLWNTLECCFLHDTLEQVSALLFIHISTLRYRLQKIQTLTNYNYFNIQDRTTLYQAYILYKLQSVEKPGLH